MKDDWWYANEDEKMEFDKSRVYTALNADELRAGDKVIVADTIMELRDFIEEKAGAMKCYAIIKEILPDNREKRFALDDNMRYSLAYLVERKENCTNCGEHEDCGFVQNQSCFANLNRCEDWKPKTEKSCKDCELSIQEADDLICIKDGRKIFQPEKVCTDFRIKKHYRPFRDTDELVKVWGEKIKAVCDDIDEIPPIVKPLIWVRQKECNKGGLLITYFGEDEVKTDVGFITMSKLLSDYTFTDGAPCGVEE